MQEAANRQREKERVDYRKAKEAWDRRAKQLERDIAGLQKDLKQSQKKIELMETKQKVTYRLRQGDIESGAQDGTRFFFPCILFCTFSTDT